MEKKQFYFQACEEWGNVGFPHGMFQWNVQVHSGQKKGSLEPILPTWKFSAYKLYLKPRGQIRLSRGNIWCEKWKSNLREISSKEWIEKKKQMKLKSFIQRGMERVTEEMSREEKLLGTKTWLHHWILWQAT